MLGKIPIVASEEKLLDEASCGDRDEGEDAKEDSLKEGGARPKVFANGDVCDRDNLYQQNWKL